MNYNDKNLFFMILVLFMSLTLTQAVNSSVTPTNNILFEDNFTSGTLNTTKWSVYSSVNLGEWSITNYNGNNWLKHLYTGSSTGHTDWNYLLSENITVNGYFNITYKTILKTYTDDLSGLLLCDTNCSSTSNYLYRFGIWGEQSMILVQNYTAGTLSDLVTNSYNVQLNTLYSVKIIFENNTFSYYVDSQLVATQYNVFNMPKEIKIGLTSRGYQGESCEDLFNNVLVQSNKTVTITPTSTSVTTTPNQTKTVTKTANGFGIITLITSVAVSMVLFKRKKK